ncbi:hypothetical protein WICMUC_002190 [Wickerhamomyces mucosus]|uniref:Phosphoribulokinase/uridine kinase domain-containing protein n=1 Tax=Wickerhamomyces mucosus TaxID=1378264 RepID=A0A9P8PPS8_9ASCO|nr:hypothetical protein WICMUC_002190 [Wickerhamomyces mucosus]
MCAMRSKISCESIGSFSSSSSSSVNDGGVFGDTEEPNSLDNERLSRASIFGLSLSSPAFGCTDSLVGNPSTQYANWDCPEALNLEAFEAELDHLKQCGEFSKTEYRYESDTKDQVLSIPNDAMFDKVKLNLNNIIALNNFRIVFVDGFMLFNSREVIKKLDSKIFITAHYQTLKSRRERRLGYQTQETFWEDPPDYFDKIVFPAYSKTHGYLFENNDVNKSLSAHLSAKFRIHAVQNNDENTIEFLIREVATSLLLDLRDLSREFYQ